MADVSLPHFPLEEPIDFTIEEISTLDSFPFWSHSHFYGSDEDRKNQVNFVMDLFHQRVEQSHVIVNESPLGVIDENYEMGTICFDDEEEDYDNDNDNDDDISIPLCWDSLRLDDEQQHAGENDFEWEEIDGGIDPDENLEWEVLLNVNHLGANIDMDNFAGPYIYDDEFYHNDDEYEMMFGEFVEDDESGFLGRPPASKSVVEGLPSIVMSEVEVFNEDVVCAVCKDHFGVGEEVKELPCSHRYHGECIVPWLEIRNTCPVCRYELPTDDPDYEQRRVRRAARGT